MDSPVSAQESEYDRGPRRLSALYQYHNAPEVAPAHGLEYDDTIYPHSDKIAFVREFPFRHHNYGGKHAMDAENLPPRIIFGMKVRTFLVVALIVLLIVVGAAVGGAVGGKNLQQGLTSSSSRTVGQTSANSSTSRSITTTISTFSAPTPTYTPLSDCPKSNGTIYVSTFATKSSNSKAGQQTFTKYCDLVPPDSAQHISGTFVYSFSDCADLCASYNFATGTSDCNIAYYQPDARRPDVNCWIGTGQAIFSILEPRHGTDVAILIPSL